jgi:hypothetical protein
MKDTRDQRFPLVDWACDIVSSRLNGLKTARARPQGVPLSPADIRAIVLVEEALQALPPKFIRDPNDYSGSEPTSTDWEATGASLGEVHRLAMQAEAYCMEAKWEDLRRIVALLTYLPVLAEALRAISQSRRGFFWNWYEEVEELLHERENARLHQDLKFEELSPVLQELLDLSRLLELEDLTIRLEGVILLFCYRAIVLTASQGRWDEVITYRAIYLSCWHNEQARCALQRNVEHRSSTPKHLWGAIGASLAAIHGQASAPGIGNCKPTGNDSRSQGPFSAYTTFPSIAALQLDMNIAFRGTSPEEWDDFMEGYLKNANCSPAFKAELRKLKRPSDESWTHEYHGVDDPPVPAFVVRLCTYVLQTKEVAPSFSERLEDMRNSQNLVYQCRLAAQLIAQSSSVEAEVTKEAFNCFYSGIQTLLNAGEYRLTVELGETALYQVQEMITEEYRSILMAFINSARAQLQHDPEAAAQWLFEAGCSYSKSGRRDALKYAVDIFKIAMRTTSQSSTYSKSVVQMITAMFMQAVFGEQKDALKTFLQEVHEQVDPAFLDPQAAAIVKACQNAAEAWTTKHPDARIRLLKSAIQATEGNKESRYLNTLWSAYVERLTMPESAWDNPDALVAEKLREDSRHALADEQWTSLVILARRDLKAICEDTKSAPEDFGRQVALLARGLQKAAGCDFASKEKFAEEAKGLLLTYATTFLEAPARTAEARCCWAAHASDLGFSVVRLSRFMAGDIKGVLQSAVELLKRAVAFTSPTERPVEYATYLHDVGHATILLAEFVETSARAELVAKSCALFRESLVIFRVLRAKPEYAAAMATRFEDVDYLNLARMNVCLGAAYSGLDDKFEFPVSGLCFRAAFCLLAKARDLAFAAQRGPEAAMACLELAQVAISMAGACLEHTRSTRGSFRRKFENWLHAIEGHVDSTWDFAKRYAMHAMRSIETALEIALAIGDESLVNRGVRKLFEVWRLAEMRHGVSGGSILHNDNRSNMAPLRRRALVTVASLLARIEAEMGARGSDGFIKELREYRKYFRGLLKIELYQVIGGQIEFISEARAEFGWLSENGNLISRGLARPWDLWLEADSHPEGVATNGIFIGRAADGLEIRIMAQRRALCLRGVTLEDTCIQLRESSWVKTNCLSAIAYLEPQVNWSDVPALTPTIVAHCKTGQGAFHLLAVRLPTSSWDTWVIRVRKLFDGELTLPLPFKYVGCYDRVHQKFTGPASTHVKTEDDVLMFEHDRLILEASASFQNDESGRPLSVRSGEAASYLQINAEEVILSLRTSPQIVPADTAMLVKTDNIWGPACCAASFPLVAPSMTMPAAMMRAFGPLFFFDSEIPGDIREHFQQSSYHEVFLVGVPSNSEHLDAALDLLFDPRRELFLLIEPTELDMADEAVSRLKRRVASALGSSLFTLAASVDEELDPFERIQIVAVSRPLAPAAAQILLDLAAWRRHPIDDIATALAGGELLGDPGGMLRGITRLPSPVGWKELAAKYVKLVRDWPLEQLTGRSIDNPKIDRLMQVETQGLTERPCLVVPQESAILLASIPYARHVGALLLPDCESGRQFCQKLAPGEIFCFEGSPLQRLPVAKLLPHDPLDLAKLVSAVARENHEQRVAELLKVYPYTLASLRLSQEMAPSEYAVVASISAVDPWPSFLAANYAAALGSPVLLVDDSMLFETGNRRRQSDLLTGRFLTFQSTRGQVRNFVMQESEDLSVLLAHSSRGFDTTLRELKPRYVAFVSSRVFAPLELAGTPPIATRYAVGRLAGPDLASTSLLITSAALCENAARDPTLRAVLSDAAHAVVGRPLPGAKQEIDSLEKLFAAFRDLQVERIEGADDLSRFLDRIGNANIIHFAGHGLYDDEDENQSCLVFEHGRLRAADLTTRLRGFPIVFSNACETGVTSQSRSAGRGWTGLAAAFIAAGAVNYIGTLWPVFDDSSCRLSGRFYSLLSDGFSSGEALRIAREESYRSDDPTWAAMVLFGCPRNRLRASQSQAGNSKT